MIFRRTLLLLAVLSCGACTGLSNDDRAAVLRRFPIGIYSVKAPKDLDRLREDGFDTFFADANGMEGLRALARKAGKLGMTMILSPKALWDGPSSETRRWPVGGWYLQDEPDVNGVSPEALEAVSRRVRQWDSGRLQAFVVGDGAQAKYYGRIADVLMVDWYPVPHLKLDSVADHIDEAYKHMPKGKPLWMVLQAFDWREEPQRDPKKPRVGRFPDHAEIRFMSYLSIVHGAKGLFYFRLYRPSGEALFEYPELWQAVARVTLEIKSLQPILERGRPIPLPFAIKSKALEAAAWRWRGRDYVVLLNRKATVYQKVPDGLLDMRWRPLFEPRRDPRDLLTPMHGAWYLKPYQVLVFEGPLGWRS